MDIYKKYNLSKDFAYDRQNADVIHVADPNIIGVGPRWWCNHVSNYENGREDWSREVQPMRGFGVGLTILEKQNSCSWLQHRLVHSCDDDGIGRCVIMCGLVFCS